MAPVVRLEIFGADIEGTTLPVGLGTSVLGRAPASTIQLNHPRVSRRHAEIRNDGSAVQIADMGSANGTLVNKIELPVKEWQLLSIGDLIEIGPFSMRLVDANAPFRSAAEHLIGPVSISPTTEPVLRVKIQGKTHDFTLTQLSYNLGRSPENDIVLDDPAVSRFHARLERQGETYEVIDLGGINGLTFDSGRVERKLLNPGESFRIGRSVALEYRPNERTGETIQPKPIDLRSRPETVLGRGPDSDGVLRHPGVSRMHARVLNLDGRLVIEDTDSGTGTFVNGNRVKRLVLNEEDLISLGGQSLKLVNGQLHALEEDELKLEAVRLRRVVSTGATILHDVSFEIRSCEFVAIVGPSGAGKSTLINALCGYEPASSGSVTINDIDFYSHLEAFRQDIGFVPQDDIVHRELSILRAFNYAARLRMPEDMRSFEREMRCYDVLDELTLTADGDTPVSHLSGGQRKRVSIGVELLTHPSLLFLDEATSGLDPGTETQMMKLFRNLADNGRIVVLVTHATKNVMLCDKVAFMAKGGFLAFYGPPGEALTYFGAEAFDEIYLKLAQKPGEDWGNLFLARSYSSAKERYDRNGTRSNAVKQMRDTVPPTSSINQLLTLTSRSVEILWRTPRDLIVLLLLAPFVGAWDFVLWTLTGKSHMFDPAKGSPTDALNVSLMLVIVTFLVGSLSSVREIVKEQAIYKRERMVSLQVLPYVMSKMIIGLAFSTYSAVVLFTLQVVSVDFSALPFNALLELFLAILLATFSGVMIALVVSALSATENNAILLTIGLIVMQFLFSGALQVDLPHVATAPISAKWAFAAMVTASGVKRGDCTAADLSDCHVPGLDAQISLDAKHGVIESLKPYGRIFDVDEQQYLAAMLVLVVFYSLLLTIVQKRKDLV